MKKLEKMTNGEIYREIWDYNIAIFTLIEELARRQKKSGDHHKNEKSEE